jgi:uncharacterized protein
VGSRALTVFFALAAIPPGSAGAEQRVLLVDEARGFVHESIPAARELVVSLGRRSSRFEVVRLDGAAQLTAARLRHADAVVFASTSGELPLPDRAALIRFVRRGGGFVGTHSATDTLHSWTRYERLLGAEFARHGAFQPGRLVVTRRASALTRGLPRSIHWTDEFYEFTRPLPSYARVLVRLDAGSVPDELRDDIPLVWTRRFGAGRVFYDALGHAPDAWQSPLQRRLLARGIRWVLAGRAR